jgi:hypothetical protein
MGPLAFVPGRSFFVGSEAPKEIQDFYIGKCFIRSKGERIPFRYINIGDVPADGAGVTPPPAATGSA